MHVSVTTETQAVVIDGEVEHVASIAVKTEVVDSAKQGPRGPQGAKGLISAANIDGGDAFSIPAPVAPVDGGNAFSQYD